MLFICPGVKHRAAMPWCYYDKGRNKIVMRIKCPGDIESAVLLWGDPYDGKFAEAQMHRQFHGPSQSVWKIELDLPRSKRIKYGFKLKNINSPAGELYFAENGIEPYTAETVNNSQNHFYYPFVHEVDALQTVEWAKNTVWYQIFPDRFYRSVDTNVGGDNTLQQNLEDWETGNLGLPGKPHFRSFFGGNLAGIRKKLSWIKGLGINGLYLTPVFRSPSNHKYNIEDYFAIDPHFGDLNEMKALVAEVHALNIRVMLDAVFNHAGSTHPFWLDVLEKQEHSPYRDYFHIHQFPIRQHDPAQFSHDLDFHTFAWTPRMPKWNTENPDARKYLLDSAAYWIKECDIDGWRLDVANEVSFDFWKDFSRMARSLKTDFYIVGEIWHDASAWINSGLFDTVMNYPLQAAVSDCFIKKKTSPQTFTEKLFAVLTRYSDLHNRMSFNLLDSHDTDRVLTRGGGNKQAVKNAFTMLFLLPGSPCIYYGTEIGMEGGHDPDCRRPMIWNEKLQDNELLNFFQKLIEFRKKYFSIIENSVLSYYENKAVHCWEFSGKAESLVIMYTEEAGQNIEVPEWSGACVFETGPVLNSRNTGELSPNVMVVFHRRDV